MYQCYFRTILERTGFRDRRYRFKEVEEYIILKNDKPIINTSSFKTPFESNIKKPFIKLGIFNPKKENKRVWI